MTYGKSAWVCAALLLASCGDGTKVALPVVVDRSPVTDNPPDASVAECDEVPNGTPCGKPGAETHCIFDVCLRNVCGDSVRAGDEACDDGNERDHDGCSARCEIDVPSCGNGKLDPTEECDSDNRELCTVACKKPRCGDGLISPGEECDEGRPAGSASCSASCRRPVMLADAGADAGVAGDAGQDAAPANPGGDAGKDAGMDAAAEAGVDAGKDAGSDAGKEAGGSTGPEAGIDPGNGSGCRACRETHCRTYNDIDFFAGCLKAVNPDLGADPGDPTFIQHCLDAVVCAQQHRCHLNPLTGGSGCYCGAVSADTCNNVGPAADAPCLQQWITASTLPGGPVATNMDVQARFSDFQYPSAWAFFLLECDLKNCNSPQVGDCTVPSSDNTPP